VADIPEYGGLDPTIVGYLQGGGMPPGGPIAPPPEQITASPDQTQSYGLPPQVLAGVQNGFVPPPMPLAPIAPPETPPPSGSEPITSPDQIATTPPVPVVATPPVVVTTGPVTQPGQASAPPDDARVAPAQFVGDVAQNAAHAKAQAAFRMTPEGIAQRADDQQRAALDKERQSATDALAAEQAQNTATTSARQASRARQAKQDAIDVAKAAQDQANTAKYTQLYAQQIKDAADYKVDTNRSVSTGGLIAIALSGIGDALDHRHGPNTALQIINDSIDKRINDQWAQKKSLGETAQGTKSVLDEYRHNTDDDRQAMQFQRAAELTRTADEIGLIKAQYANPAAKARADQLQAGLMQKAASITMGEAQRKAAAIREAQEEADKRATLGVAYGHLALAQKQHEDSLKQNDRDFALKVAELGAKGGAATAAQLTDQGLMAPSGTITAPDGTMKPKFDYLVQQDKAPYIMPKEEAKEIRSRYAGTVQAIDALDELRRLRSENGGNFTNLSPDARAKAMELERTLIGMHEASGITGFRGNIMEVMKEQVTGGADPTSVLQSIMPELDRARGNMVKDLNSHLRAKGGYTGDDLSFPDPLKMNVVRAPDEDALDSVMKRPKAEDYGKELNIDPTDALKQGLGYQERDRRAEQIRQGFDKDETILPSQKAKLDSFAQAISDPRVSEKDRARATEFLNKAAESSQSPAIRSYARAAATQAMVNVRAGGAMPSEDPGTSSSSTARDTSYGGTAQTAPAQRMLESVPLDSLAQQAHIAPEGSHERVDAQREILRRADAGDKQAKKEIVLLVQQKGGR